MSTDQFLRVHIDTLLKIDRRRANEIMSPPPSNKPYTLAVYGKRVNNSIAQIICPKCKDLVRIQNWVLHKCAPRDRLVCPWLCPEKKKYSNQLEKAKDVLHLKECLERFKTTNSRFNAGHPTAVRYNFVPSEYQKPGMISEDDMQPFTTVPFEKLVFKKKK